MNGDRWEIVRAEGGFLVQVSKHSNPLADEGALTSPSYQQRVFTDSSSLLNYLHNELVGSN